MLPGRMVGGEVTIQRLTVGLSGHLRMRKGDDGGLKIFNKSAKETFRN